MLLVIGPLCGLGLVDAFEVGLVGVTSTRAYLKCQKPVALRYWYGA